MKMNFFSLLCLAACLLQLGCSTTISNSVPAYNIGREIRLTNISGNKLYVTVRYSGKREEFTLEPGESKSILQPWANTPAVLITYVGEDLKGMQHQFVDEDTIDYGARLKTVEYALDAK